MLAELGSENSQADLCLLDVRACDLDKHILRVESDLGRLRVDDWWQGQHLTILVEEDGVLVEWLQDGQKLLHLDIFAEDIKEGVCVHSFGLLKSLEDDLVRGKCFVRDGSSELVQVVGSHGSEGPPSADVLMELVLQVNERVV